MTTTVEILISNSGGPINNLAIRDLIADKLRFGPEFFAAGDGKRITDFSVRDAARLVTDIEIFYDDVSRYKLQDVTNDSTVDVWTGNVNPL